MLNELCIVWMGR